MEADDSFFLLNAIFISTIPNLPRGRTGTLFLNLLQNSLTFSISFAKRNWFSGFQLETGVDGSVQIFDRGSSVPFASLSMGVMSRPVLDVADAHPHMGRSSWFKLLR